MNAAPGTRHQLAVMQIAAALFDHRRSHGGQVLPAPLDVYFADDNVVEPDVLFIRADHLDRLGTKYLQGPPDLAVEISSPSTRRLELVRKRELYERFGVPEYWYVDLEIDRVEIYSLVEGRYPAPQLRYPAELVESTQLLGFAMPAGEALEVDAT